MSRSPAYCLVLIPPPGPGLGGCEEETRAPACAGNGKPPARPPRGHGRRGRPPAEAEPRAAGRGHTPLSRRRPSATGRRGCSFSLRGPDSCSWWGRGRATPRRARPPPAVTRGFTRPAERGPGRHARRDPQVYQAPPPPGGRASPVVPRLPHPHRYPLPGLRTPSPHLLHAEIESQPHPPQPAGNIQVLPPPPPPRNPGNSARGLGRAPPRGRLDRSTASPRSTWRALPGRLGSQPRGQVRPSRRRAAAARVGEEGWVPPQRGARRLRRREGGRGGGRGRGAAGRGRLTCATAMPAAAESFSLGRKRAAGRRGGGGCGEVGRARKRTDRGRRCLGHPREAGDRAGPWGKPGVRALFPPPPPNPRGPDQTGRPSGPRRRSGSK